MSEAESVVTRLRRVLVLLGLSAGPGAFLIGSVLAGRLPEGREWLDTVMLLPLISIGASGAVIGIFAVAALLGRWLDRLRERGR